jgi:hypothetical protein
MRLARITISTMIAVAAIVAFTASGASADSPCPPGVPYGSDPQRADGTQRPANYPVGKCQLLLDQQSRQAGTQGKASGSGFKAGSPVALNMDGTSIGGGNADSAGVFTAAFTVPVNATPGQHTVTATGVDPSGQAFELAAPLEVTAAPAAASSASAAVTPAATPGASPASPGAGSPPQHRSRCRPRP